jgi:L-cysteine S-thiosulfotransferase
MPVTGTARSPTRSGAELTCAVLFCLTASVAGAQGIAEPLTGTPGDAARGREIVADTRKGLCLLCHSGPFPEVRFQGDLAPDLRGAGARWSVAELRQRVVDSREVNPDTIMPPYHSLVRLNRVGESWRGHTIFTAQEVEDVVAFLATLKGEPE